MTESLAHTPMRVLDKMCRERGFGLKLRAVSKTYIWDILSNSTNDITFIRSNEAFEYPWTSDVYAKLTMTPSLDTQIVLQTTLDSIDDELLRCIRKSLAERKFD